MRFAFCSQIVVSAEVIQRDGSTASEAAWSFCKATTAPSS